MYRVPLEGGVEKCLIEGIELLRKGLGLKLNLFWKTEENAVKKLSLLIVKSK